MTTVGLSSMMAEDSEDRVLKPKEVIDNEYKNRFSYEN
jgi:hypothetical protein